MQQEMAQPRNDWTRRLWGWLRSTLLLVLPRPVAPPSARELALWREARLRAERDHAFRMEGKRIGCLLVHGLTSTPQSLHGLGRYLADHGVDVEAVLLPGHGTTPEDLESTTWMDWYEAVESALRRLRPRCDRLFVCGQSMGGALALRAAAREPVDGVVTLAGFVFLRDWRVRFVPLMKHVVRWRKCIGNDIADPEARDEVCYDRMSLRTVEQLVQLGQAARLDLPRIQVPALVVQSRVDHVVPPQNADFIYDQLGSSDKELLRLEHSFHVVSMDYERDLVADRAVRFMRRVAFAESRRRS
jgi:carboxylesterase